MIGPDQKEMEHTLHFLNKTVFLCCIRLSALFENEILQIVMSLKYSNPLFMGPIT